MQFNFAATVLLFIGLAQAAPAIVARASCPPGAPTPIGSSGLCTKYDSSPNNACALDAKAAAGTYSLCSDAKWQKP
ncbi:hypothetical protein HYFRA_00012515 [Hymenoscyphus fraxineus]|uniref:Uncharacterized protein n=1 Tax=Hymenoscyphus fraxineus TaxID=746836 RepID=A0A9N9PKF2_9HELO|nr:hypothetical protein HYFRA_00012515 [Hymenoscyphus fraxineus]